MSRPLMPIENHVSKNATQPKRIVLNGFAYLESFNPHGTRVFVPGYSEDFMIPNVPGFNPTNMLDHWIQFSIFAETKELDREAPMMLVAAPIPSRPGTIAVLCEKVGSIVKTVDEGHEVTDPDNELGVRGLAENFKLELRLRLKAGLPNKPVFVVDKIQPTLPKRVVPRELVKPQNPQPQGYSMRQNHGRNRHQNPATNSDLPRHLCPVTSRNNRPKPVFHNDLDAQHQHTPPPSFGNVRGNNDESSHRRSSASSAECHNPPRNFAEPTTSQNYSSGRTYTGEMQNSQAENDKKIADLVRSELKNNPKFGDMLASSFPEFTSRLMDLL